MARVIVLDASVIIAHFSSRDTHHDAATAFFRASVDEEFLVHPLTLTEVLVGPMRSGREGRALQLISELGITEWTPDSGSAARLARLRVESALKLPDCCVLDAAMVTRSSLVTFDLRLARAGTLVGVHALELPLDPSR